MASSATPLPEGTTSYSSTTASTTVADIVNFPDRYGYVTVTNDGTVALYVRADQPLSGTAATVAGANCYVVPPGQTQVFANGLPLWYQSSRVLQQGAIQVGNGSAYNHSTNPSTPSNPGTVTPMGSLAGEIAPPGASGVIANPGTVVSVIAGTVAQAYTVAAAG